MNTYWFFEFKLDDYDTGFHTSDHSVVSSVDGFFPVANVFAWKDEEFGEHAQLIITNVIEITESDYNSMSQRIESETNG